MAEKNDDTKTTETEESVKEIFDKKETKDDEFNISFFAYDLTDCPEDATLTRDLFTGNEYIEALRLGMKLAQAGYTFIDAIHVDKDKYD